MSFLREKNPADTLTFRNKGDAAISNNTICISAGPGDVLSYYLLSASTNHYHTPLAVEKKVTRHWSDGKITQQDK